MAIILLVAAQAARADDPTIKINFGPAVCNVSADYIRDWGATYTDHLGTGLSYGWTPLGYRYALDPTSIDPLDSSCSLPDASQIKWELGVPEGEYSVTLVCRSGMGVSPNNEVMIENTVCPDPTPGTGDWDTFTATVDVEDGKLTIERGPNSNGSIGVAYVWVTGPFDLPAAPFPQPYLPALSTTGGFMTGRQIALVDRSLDLDGSITGWVWKFDDDVIAETQDATYTIPERTFGEHEISLTVTDDDTPGNENTYAVTVDVGYSPQTKAAESGYIVVVGNDDLLGAVAELIEWKRLKGFQVEVYSASPSQALEVTEIVDEYDDPLCDYWDDQNHCWNEGGPELLRQYLRERFEDETKVPLHYVLLVGDYQDVPAFSIATSIPSFVSDQPTMCLGGLDPGSPTQADVYPDVAYGRLSVRASDEDELAAAYVAAAKILKYDRNPASGNWMGNSLVVASFDDADLDKVGGHNTSVFMRDLVNAGAAIDTQTDMGVEYVVSAPYEPTSPPYYLYGGVDEIPSAVLAGFAVGEDAVDAVISTINSGVGLLVYRGHGYPYGWADPNLIVSDILHALDNGDMTPVIYQGTCSTGDFTGVGTGDCLSEAWLKKSERGAVGVFGATAVTSSRPPGFLECFWDGFDPTYDASENGYVQSMRPAEALNFENYYYAGASVSPGELETIQQMHWFGDPEMMLRTAVPKAYSVSILDDEDELDSLQVGATYEDFKVYVEFAATQQPVEGARVCIRRIENREQLDRDYWVGLTDEYGYAYFPDLTPGAAGAHTVVVTGYNGYPHEDTILADIDGDADLDESDVLEMYAYFSNPDYDLNDDGYTDGGDVEYLVETVMGYGPGDANLDGVVSGADYVAWANHFGLGSAYWAHWADVNYDGTITGADYVVWANNFGEMTEHGGEMMMMQMLSLLTGPTLEYTSADLGGGLTGYSFYIANDDELEEAYAVALAFEGVGEATVKQVLYNGSAQIDTESLATMFDGMGTPAYDKETDSWAREPFEDGPIPGFNPLDEEEFTGFVHETNAYVMSLGTGANSEYGDETPVAYVVADGDVQWCGLISRDTDYEVSGTTAAE